MLLALKLALAADIYDNQNRIKESDTVKVIKPKKCRKKIYRNYENICQNLSDDEFYDRLQIHKSTFDYIFKNIENGLKRSKNRTEVSPREILQITLEYLITGGSMLRISQTQKLNRRFVPKLIERVCKVIYDKLGPLHMPKFEKKDWERISNEYYQRFGFPHCLGSIDIKKLQVKASTCFDLETFLFGIVDPSFKFIYSDLITFNKVTDEKLFQNCKFFRDLEDDALNIPEPDNLPKSNLATPYVFLGNENLELTKYILTPYPGDMINQEESNFNLRFAKSKLCSQYTFGMLLNKFKVLTTNFAVSISKVTNIVKAIMTLHNVILDLEGCTMNDAVQFSNEKFVDPANIDILDEEALRIRDIYKYYFNFIDIDDNVDLVSIIL
ncbi:unnamed protein product [Gordionus sp. m RMFG-2023]|uniref:uncharacterized protein LOC135924730 n=1 Tax=Gordionus sp. m RMFG-2023 TaxID=3053472 RepID=UPI0030E12F46